MDEEPPVIDFERVVIGPCPCSWCGDPLYWNGLLWNERVGGHRRRHICSAEPRFLDPYPVPPRDDREHWQTLSPNDR